MKRVLFASCILALGLPGLAHATTAVYPGCAVPSLKAGYHTFYVDPAKGSPEGDGSAAKPWRTLAEVLGATSKLLSTQGHKVVGGTDPLQPVNANGPIKAGDVIMLMSGNHGNVTINNATNADFVTVMAAPGQTPVIGQMFVKSSAKWLFQGLKFQGQNTAPAPSNIGARDLANLVTLGRGEWLGGSSDLVFTQNTFSTADNTNGWSATDWLLKPFYYGLENRVPCTSLVNNSFLNFLNAVADTASNFLAQGNTINGFANDAFEFTASNVTLKGNVIKGGASNTLNPWHPDGIQGWSAVTNGVPATNTNVLIDGNTIIKTGDPNVSTMQGISIFDGKWKGLTIQNNTIVTNHWHGIAVYGAQSLRILNNTIVASEPVSHATWITVNPGKDGVHSSDVVVRNNISPALVIADTGVTYDHNAIGSSYTALTGGKATVQRNSDTNMSNMIYSSLASQFVNVNNATGTYDLRLKSTSVLAGTGSPVMAPTSDITGKARGKKVDPGAYTQ